MTSRLKQMIAGAGFCVLSLVAVTATISTSEAQNFNQPQSLREKLIQAIETPSGGQLKIVALTPTPLATVFQVELNTGEILYTDIAGDYLFAGDMYQTTPAGLQNLTVNTRQLRTLEKIAAIPEDEMIVFTPEVVKASITVFTDVDCGYCRKLHGDLAQLMDLGIEVRYLAYPRGGRRADSYEKMISVWCSDDRKKSLTQAKNGQNLPERDCDSPILAHYELGNSIGLTGTPALIFPDGKLIPGYVEADRLAEMLQLN